MEKTELTISIETERLEALTFYLQKEKTTTLPKELGKMLEELYEKTVPADVRDYIGSRCKKPPAPKPKTKPGTKMTPSTNDERTDQKD